MSIDSYTVPGSFFGHDGWEFRVEITPDDAGIRPETDGDWATPEIIAAWKRDDWEYVNVDVTPIDDMGRAWERERQSLDAVVWGILHDGTTIGRADVNKNTLPDMVAEAMREITANQ